ncbi:M14 family zinc carboxypeptidase [Microbacterium lacusdiani]
MTRRGTGLQGRIHGNEPYGVDSTLAVLKELGTNGSAEWELLRDTYTFHVIPMYNPDGSAAARASTRTSRP